MAQTEKRTLKCNDGTTIDYQYCAAGISGERASVLLFFSGFTGGENIFPECFNFRCFIFTSLEHAMSEKNAVENLLYNINKFVENIKATYDLSDQDIAVYAQGIWAVIAASWVHDYAPNIRALVLSSPSFQFRHRIATICPWPKTSAIKSRLSFFGDFLSDLRFTIKRLVEDAAAIHVPVQLVQSTTDSALNRCVQKRFYTRLSSSRKVIFTPTGEWKEGTECIAWEEVNRFITECFTLSIALPSLKDADKCGYTKKEQDILLRPEANPAKKMYWLLSRMMIRHVGKYAKGIKIGLNTGFDSGISLDYIYDNQADGDNTFGKFIDRSYLNNIGWRGVRLRKKHVEELMLLAIQRLAERQETINILDIAAGYGRYVLDVFDSLSQPLNHILMRDYDDKNVHQGKSLIQQKGLNGIADFERGDAFSMQDLSTLPKDRTLAIASGFYELFSDNAMVSDSLAGIAAALQEGGYFIYTGIPWHPNREYLARVLTSHKDDNAWVLRRRTQLELDQLVAGAGFDKVTQRIDPYGIYSVSLAIKRGV